jgi:hypothetical protein
VAHSGVWVEYFFSRIMMKFSFIRNVYYWSHSHFDMDFLIAYCLMNESIILGQLDVQEYTTMKAIINKRLKLFEEQENENKLHIERIRNVDCWEAFETTCDIVILFSKINLAFSSSSLI